MKVYITFLGRSIWAVINSFYAVLKEKKFQPDLIYLIIEDLFEEKVDKVIDGLKILSEEFSFTTEIKEIFVQEAEFFEAGMQINALIQDLTTNNHTIAVDLTPGRKSLVAAVLIPLSKIYVEHIFYLAIKTIKGVNFPYEMIPKHFQSLKDFIKEAKVKNSGN